MSIERGQVYFVDRNPVQGREQDGQRPCPYCQLRNPESSEIRVKRCLFLAFDGAMPLRFPAMRAHPRDDHPCIMGRHFLAAILADWPRVGVGLGCDVALGDRSVADSDDEDQRAQHEDENHQPGPMRAKTQKAITMPNVKSTRSGGAWFALFGKADRQS